MITYNPEVIQREQHRHALIDADCVAYWGAAGCDDQALRSATRRVDQRMNQILDECNALNYTGYLTGIDNFRDDVATFQRYKGNRYDKYGKRLKPQPMWLPECREYLKEEWGCVITNGQEADDALSIHSKVKDSNTYIISSIDKDLRINEGMHHDMNSGEIDEVHGFGDLYLHKGGAKGTGLKFFYAQMIMGDGADWIKGLPKVTEYMKDTWPGLRRGGAGAKAAYTIMQDISTQENALQVVWDCYKSYWMEHEYRHWRTGVLYKAGFSTAKKQFLEQGRLLWMRTKEDEIWTPEFLFQK